MVIPVSEGGVVSDVTAVKEALEWFSEPEQDWVENHEPLLALAEAARRFVLMVEVGREEIATEGYKLPTLQGVPVRSPGQYLVIPVSDGGSET